MAARIHRDMSSSRPVGSDRVLLSWRDTKLSGSLGFQAAPKNPNIKGQVHVVTKRRAQVGSISYHSHLVLDGTSNLVRAFTWYHVSKKYPVPVFFMCNPWV